MRMKLILKGILFFSIISTSNADTLEPVNNKLDYLKKYIGTYEDNKIFTNKFISIELHKLLGNEISHLKTNLSVMGPINYISKELVIFGNAPHQGGTEQAIISINLDNKNISVAIYSYGNITIYSKYDTYKYLPISIKDHIAVWQTNGKFRNELPEKLKMISKHK